MKMFFLMVALATVAFASGTEFGVQVGYWNPNGDAGDAYDGNFYFGGQFLSHMRVIAIEASIGYTPLKQDDGVAVPGFEFSGKMIPITGGIRSYSGAMYGAAGLELDMVSWESENAVTPALNTDGSSSELGGYIGAGYIKPMGTTGDLDFNVRLHLMEFETDQMWLSFGAGLNF